MMSARDGEQIEQRYRELHAEIAELKAKLTTLLCKAHGNGFIGDNVDDAIEWAVRQMAEAHRLRREQRFCARCKAAIDEGHDRG